MKKLLLFIWSWIVSIFMDNHIIPTPSGEEEEETKAPKFLRSNHPRTASHNNRRATKGRHIQIVGRRTIYHEAK